MRNRPLERGTALLLATVVVLLVVGIGGAFLAETLIRGKSQFTSNQEDEALAVCNAALEKVRRALFKYKSAGSWPWDSVLAYCSTAPQKTSAQMILDLGNANDPNSLWQSAVFQADLVSARQTGNDTQNEAPLPGSLLQWAPGNPAVAPQQYPFICQYSPFGGGAFWAVVTNNDDTATGGGPLHDTDNTVVVTITAMLRSGIQRKIEAVVTYGHPGVHFPGLAAIISDGPVSFNGNITIDGRDHDMSGNLVTTMVDPNGNTVPDPGAYGVMSGGTIAYGGTSTSGGNGTAPARGGSPGSSSANQANWSQLNAPPPSGGPAPTNFPADPDGVLQLAPGTLLAFAQQAGTYFSSQADYDSFLASNASIVPGGVIIYCDFTPSPPFLLGSSMNTQPSLLIVHNSTGTASMENIHGDFKGLILADAIKHINSSADILGSVLAWGQTGNVFGNGTSTVSFSSDVLNHLPSLNPSVSAQVLSYRKMTP
jgi:type II secretory pathway pseudopilin PulG